MELERGNFRQEEARPTQKDLPLQASYLCTSNALSTGSEGAQEPTASAGGVNLKEADSSVNFVEIDEDIEIIESASSKHPLAVPAPTATSPGPERLSIHP